MTSPLLQDKAACPCIDTNGLEQIVRNGQRLVVKRAQDGMEYEYLAAYGTKQCSKWDETLPPYCADKGGLRKPDAPAWCSKEFW